MVAIVAIALLTLMPIGIAILDLRPVAPLLHRLGTVLMVCFGGLFLGLLYRVALPGPPISDFRRQHVVPGTLLAMVIWLVACLLVSFYADHVARFAATYGPLGAVVGLMMSLYAMFYAALIGAELNAQLDRAVADAAPRGAAARLRVAE